MSTLLRRVQSTIAVFDPLQNNQPQVALNPADRPSKPAKRHRLRKSSQHHHRSHSNLLEVNHLNQQPAVESRNQTLQHPEPGPLTEFRRRLARKASTFSLRTRRRQGEREQDEAIKEEEKLRELVLVGSEKARTKSQEHRDGTPVEPYTRESSVTEVAPYDPATILSVGGHPSPSKEDSPPKTSTALQDLICKTQNTYITKHVAGGKIAVKKMSSEQAPPPVPYTRLKEITENACEAALSGVTSYSHPDTEKWNTMIINSILGALVEETTVKAASGSSAASQPQYKYVVNSTIIQHAASTPASAGDDTKKTSGRRGMHAASGAYWNNEKDGMWSFKYPGADSKGLDVVVGIIWVWVG
ncbi:uncharacterized protein Z520_08985 [Fonsecaea multimorphosa CBS 102226]|uniref:Uncharacterized protein n=1 Tax=Fonsecaea multimorphosa CBS 102226 TaxID=1442371 RepID=A0A0D2KFL4_9EURO|nr:uncharacterized protein Z520_08985 [Fonsecaea multimorphosa CBS 102226]KIX95468.1 hypothetical protein Z520_08985 [Fonsecaea multimorphosa CBS 102226]OAL20999.1 hypothetical protein AYO22_08419 [Fonsecaea multimorphosa]